MRITIALVAALSLSGCATSSSGLARLDADQSHISAKPPGVVATCVVETLIGENHIRNEGEHYWVLRVNGYGIPMIRWDFTPRPDGGTLVELRATVNVNSGDEKVKACL